MCSITEASWNYSLIYRASNKFQMAKLAPNWDLAHTYEVLQKEMPVAVKLIEWWKDRSLSGHRDSAHERGHRADLDA